MARGLVASALRRSIIVARVRRVPVRSLADSVRSAKALRCEHIALAATAQYAVHSDLPKHGGLGNPSTNEEVNMAAAKKKAPAKKAAKKKAKKK